MSARLMAGGVLLCTIALAVPTAASASVPEAACAGLATAELTRTVIASDNAEAWAADPSRANAPVGELTAGKEYHASEPSDCAVGWLTDLVSVDVDGERQSVADAKVFVPVRSADVDLDTYAVKVPGTISAPIFAYPTAASRRVGKLSEQVVAASSETWTGQPVSLVGSGEFRAVRFEGKQIGYVDSNILKLVPAPDLPKETTTPSPRDVAKGNSGSKMEGTSQAPAKDADAPKPEHDPSVLPADFQTPLAGGIGSGFVVGFVAALGRLRTKRLRT